MVAAVVIGVQMGSASPGSFTATTLYPPVSMTIFARSWAGIMASFS